MQLDKKYEWIKKEESRGKLLVAIAQPMTAKQLTSKTGIPMDTCSYMLKKFTAKGLVTCLNSDARNSRLYWLTEAGKRYSNQLRMSSNLSEKSCDLPSVDWGLYGWACYHYRAAIIRILTHPMQPSEIKRTFRLYKPDIKISANNIRDVIKLLLKKGIVQKVFVKKKKLPRYELTKEGIKFRELLLRAS